MDSLLLFDEYLFHIINGELSHWVLDTVLPIWRNKLLWVPLYVFILSFILWNFSSKAIYFILAVVLTVTIADTLSSKILKKSIKRPRPCKTEQVAEVMTLRVGCSSSYSFTSSHATNHFAIAVFWVLTLGRLFSAISLPLLLWATSIAYAQVYVGAHFPLDVIAGSLLGTFIGWSVARFYNRFWELKF